MWLLLCRRCKGKGMVKGLTCGRCHGEGLTWLGRILEKVLVFALMGPKPRDKRGKEGRT